MTKKTKVFLLCALGAFYLTLHLLKVQFTPFFIFGMYSKKVENRDFYNAYEFEINDKLVHPFNLGKEKAELAIGPMSYYLNHLKNGGEDPVEKFVLSKRPHWEQNEFYKNISEYVFTNENKLEDFPPWYKRVMESLLGYKINKIVIYSTKVKYVNFGIQTVSREKVLAIE